MKIQPIESKHLRTYIHTAGCSMSILHQFWVPVKGDLIKFESIITNVYQQTSFPPHSTLPPSRSRYRIFARTQMPGFIRSHSRMKIEKFQCVFAWLSHFGWHFTLLSIGKIVAIVRRQSDKNHSQTNWCVLFARKCVRSSKTSKICASRVFAWTGQSEMKQFKSSFFILLFIFHDSPNLKKNNTHCDTLHCIE